MAVSPASYALLGLPPGADRAAVDRAYRALMKRHHPDLGGDPERAASINHAYADITRPAGEAAGVASPTDLAAALYQRHQALLHARRAHTSRKAVRWPLWLVLAAVAGGVAWVEREPLTDLAWDLQWRYFPPVRDVASSDAELAASTGATRVQLGTAKLDGAAIVAAEAAARRTLKAGGVGAAAEASRRCFQSFHAAPSLARYDRCVAFDDAVLLIGGYGVGDRGGFSAGAVTSRQLAAARTLDRDYESIETRLDRIRLAMMRLLEAPREPTEEAIAAG